MVTVTTLFFQELKVNKVELNDMLHIKLQEIKYSLVTFIIQLEIKVQ